MHILLQSSILLRSNARKYVVHIVCKSYLLWCWGAKNKCRISQRSTLFACRSRPYYKIPTHDLALNPDQWTQKNIK